MVSPVTEEQRKEIAGRMTAHTFVSSNLNSSIPYRLYAPQLVKKGSKVPLVLYLHGSDGSGDDNYRQLNEIVDLLTSVSFQKEFPSYVLVPQCPRGHQWVDLRNERLPLQNYDQDALQESVYLRMVMELLGDFKEKSSVDLSRLYVVGFSMGATGTWDIITRHPDEFAAALILNGRSDPSKAYKIKELPIMVFHGMFDRVSPLSNAQVMMEELGKVDSPVIFNKLFWGHGIPRIVMRKPATFSWLFSKKKHGSKN